MTCAVALAGCRTEVPPNKPDGQPYARTAELSVDNAKASMTNELATVLP